MQQQAPQQNGPAVVYVAGYAQPLPPRYQQPDPFPMHAPAATHLPPIGAPAAGFGATGGNAYVAQPGWIAVPMAPQCHSPSAIGTAAEGSGVAAVQSPPSSAAVGSQAAWSQSPASTAAVVDGYRWTLAPLNPCGRVLKKVSLVVFPEMYVLFIGFIMPIVIVVLVFAAGGAAASARHRANAGVRRVGDVGVATFTTMMFLVFRRRDAAFMEWLRSPRGAQADDRYNRMGWAAVALLIYLWARLLLALYLLYLLAVVPDEKPKGISIAFPLMILCVGVCSIMIAVWLLLFLCNEMLRLCSWDSVRLRIGLLDSLAFQFGIPATFDGRQVKYSGYRVWLQQTEHTTTVRGV